MPIFSGSLLSKRKPELVEIGAALGLPTDDIRVTDLVKSIQAHLDANEAQLASNPTFKGLFYRKRSSHGNGGGNGSHTPERSSSPTIRAEIKKPESSGASTARALTSKASDRLQEVADAAKVPLPESPVALSKVSDATRAVSESVQNALVPASVPSGEITSKLQDIAQQFLQIQHRGQERVNIGIRHTRDVISTPQALTITALSAELLFLFGHVLPFYNYTYFFPPIPGKTGTLSSLVHSLFSWSPTFSWTLRLPEASGFVSSELWGAIAWWVFSTVLPPLALSTVVSFVPQKGVHRHNAPRTRYQETHLPQPTPDPLVFALSRLAILVLPLTSAAPTSLVDALEMSGNLQGRALGAALFAGLILAAKLA
ncbi:hypothetical protein J007_02968 [Cryptococcus neoformans]|nr:hypothetical protein J007_02968 [Cryptococcus neoformans var. grubii]OXC61537.1 hypothetical protein C358_03049 [Cryptococcus neoformans var. grubii MW-RSA852]